MNLCWLPDWNSLTFLNSVLQIFSDIKIVIIYVRSSWRKFQNSPKDVDERRVWIDVSRLSSEEGVDCFEVGDGVLVGDRQTVQFGDERVQQFRHIQIYCDIVLGLFL